MAAAGVATGASVVCSTPDEVAAALDALGSPYVVKDDGLAAGKGVVVCGSADEARAACRRMLVDREFGAAGRSIVLEERLRGREASVQALCDGERIVLLPSAEDHKAVRDGDQGPNTGGMGAFSPSPLLDEALLLRIERDVIGKTVAALAEQGRPYRGVLYAGLMLTPDRGPMVLEFNCRFGDPETQVVVTRFADDLYPWLAGVAKGRMPPGAPRIDPRTAVCVVQCAGGYPGRYEKGSPIEGLEIAAGLEDVVVFHAGTARAPDGRIVTAGGRVLATTALGDRAAAARARVYQAVAQIRWPGEHHRTDIAARRS
jgi:phosphoribosylamine--glycine ligase